MKNYIKILQSLIALISLICTLTVSVFAETVNGISISSDVVRTGEEFIITVEIPPLDNADTASLKVKYDDAAFEVIEWNTPDIPSSVSNSGNGVLALSAANIERVIDLSNGLTLNAKLKAKDNAIPGEFIFELTDSSLCYVRDNGYEFEELWIPTDTQISIRIEALTSTITEDVDNNTVVSNDINTQNDKDSSPFYIVIITVLVLVVVIISAVVTVKHRK